MPYVDYKEPIGYPQTSSICGIKDCTNEGVIWLTEDELTSYHNGTRIFKYKSGVTKVKVK